MSQHVKAAGELQISRHLETRDYGQKNYIECLRLHEENEIRLFETLRHVKQLGKIRKNIYVHRSR